MAAMVHVYNSSLSSLQLVCGIVLSRCVMVLKNILTHMWQSCVEIECYSVAYFDRVTTFKALYLRTSVKGGVQTCCVNAATIDAITYCI